MSTRYFVGTEPLVVDGDLSGSYADTQYGNEVTFEFYIRGDIEGDSGTGATYGESTGATYGEETGFTYGSDGLEYQTAQERYNRLKDYLNYADYGAVGGTMGSVFFNETTDFANSPVDTLVIPIRPHQDIDQAPGVWGFITGGDDTTEIFGAIARVDLTVFVLAEYGEYATEQDVRDEFEVSI